MSDCRDVDRRRQLINSDMGAEARRHRRIERGFAPIEAGENSNGKTWVKSSEI
jgi:hypothetical protein